MRKKERTTIDHAEKEKRERERERERLEIGKGSIYLFYPQSSRTVATSATKLQLTQVVPISGLAVGVVIRLEQEVATVLELWG